MSTQKPTTQRQRLEDILSGGRWWTLFEVQDECRRRFGSFDSETALSARWRELPPEKRMKRIRQGTNKTYEYRMVA
ncbi:hypothetical protein [Shewanella algae]|uniref:hypothetical protein n=1 Tax=Shewanella algae TaxID=38313 RepID=UPI0034D70FF6